jgi:P27 family predicted phage terminase small subunit
MKNSGPDAPKHLSREAKALWRNINADYELDAASQVILEGSLEAFDRMRQAQEAIKTHGITVLDRFSQQKQAPATLVERDSRTALLRGLKALGLDLEPLQAGPGRPAKGVK